LGFADHGIKPSIKVFIAQILADPSHNRLTRLRIDSKGLDEPELVFFHVGINGAGRRVVVVALLGLFCRRLGTHNYFDALYMK
jgi:hypothetical protein